MIVKIQLPIEANVEDPEALVYDEKHEVDTFMPITKELLRRMGGNIKKFFYAHLEDEEIIIDQDAPFQDW
jgi:hypothetical protein